MDIHGRYHSSDRNGGAAREARRPPISLAFVISSSRVLIHACVLCSFVWRACVVLFCVARVCCALLSAAHASARPGSAPAGKPPAKRLGKHRASRPSGGGILEEKYLTLSVFRSKKCHLEFRNASTIEKNKVYRVGLKPISGPRLCCKDAGSSILSSVAFLGAEL